MFCSSQFNQELDPWDVSSVTEMEGMFYTSQFNNKWLASWNVLGVTNMAYMFFVDSAFNQDLCSWGPKLQNTTWVNSMFDLTSCTNQTDPNLDLSPPTPLCFNCV
jgi:hypothetical protein